MRIVPADYVADVNDALSAYAVMTNHGILPVAGGMLDQTAGFISVVNMLDAEIASYGKSQ